MTEAIRQRYAIVDKSTQDSSQSATLEMPKKLHTFEQSEVQLADGTDPPTTTQDDDTSEVPPFSYPEGGLKAYSVVLASCIGMMCDYGFLNSIGAIESYVAQFILVNNSQLGISWVFSIFCFIAFAGNIFSGFVFDRYGARILFIIGSILIVGGLFGTANSSTLWQFVLSFSICCGFGCTLITPPCVSCVGHYFDKKRGLAMGLAISGASIGGVIWPLVCRSLYTKIGFTWTIRVLAFMFMALMAIACVLVDDRRVEIRQHEEQVKREKEKDTATTTTVHSITEGESESSFTFSHVLTYLTSIVDFSLLKDVSYDFLVVALSMNEFSLIVAFTYTPSYALDKGFGQSVSLLSLTIMNAAGIPGRYIPTYLSDKVGYFNMACVTSLCMTVSIFIIWVPFGQNLAAFMVFAVFYGISVAGTLGLIPLCTSAISKPQDYGKAYGTAYFFASFGNLVCLPIGMAITSTKGGFQAMTAFCGSISALCTLFFVLARIKLAGFKRAKI
ncbi:DEKNAAC103670 [Brettanomyces naardenensis]|uniref:DEKNAAC103670 n=1 Tax=Brettanomyces naardenensis TaxID=13370 RepID=A0A448YNU3_BRENA|nr:DEKNAAC103670 [Brettanomyces naardenensis]